MIRSWFSFSKIHSIFVIVVLATALTGLTSSTEDGDVDKLEKRLSEVTSRLYKIDKDVTNRLNPKWKRKALSLSSRVTKLEEPVCDADEYQCGQESLQCVSHLFVCDGHADCRNGEDERHCEAPIHPGDVFKGQVVFDRCGKVKPENDTITFVIDEVKKFEHFTARLGIRASFEMSFADAYERTTYSSPTKGYYNFATSSIILLPPSGESNGLICRFDGYNFNRCVGSTTAEGSLAVCAKYIYFRQKVNGAESK